MEEVVEYVPSTEVHTLKVFSLGPLLSQHCVYKISDFTNYLHVIVPLCVVGQSSHRDTLFCNVSLKGKASKSGGFWLALALL